MTYAERLARAVEYEEEAEGSVDSLIAYKNALEDALDALVDALREEGLTIPALLGSAED